MSETGTAGFTLSDHVTQIHSSYLTNRTETKTFPEIKDKWQQKRNKHPDVKKMEVLVGHCLRETQVVGIQRGRELSYGTEAQVWGIGKILIYKIDVWQILISSLMPRSHFDISNDSVSSTQNSQLIK